MLKIEITPPKFSNIDINKALVRSCLLVEETAKEKCPVDTGTLKRSITTDIKGNVGEVGTNLSYSPFVEFGTGIYNAEGRKTPWSYQTPDGQWHTTRGNRPQPFLGPALIENQKKIVDIFKEEIKKG